MTNIEAILIGLLSVAHTPEQAQQAARTALRDHAHQLAEKQRAHLRHQGYDTSCVCESCSACLATEYIDLIDPEVTP